MADITREVLYNEVRRQFPDLATNTCSEEFLATSRSCLEELLEIEIDKLSDSQKSTVEDQIWQFASKIAIWMRLKKSKAVMIRWKRKWFDMGFTLGDPDPIPSSIPILTYENASKTTQKRRKRKYADELGASALSGSLALSLHDKGLSANAQVIRELDKNPELGPQLLKSISSLKKGEDNESVLPKLAVSTIKYAANVLGLYIIKGGKLIILREAI
jgi:hypothetical protein